LTKYAPLSKFDAASARLQEDIDTLVFSCLGEEDLACVSHDQDAFQADLAATKQAYSLLIGPEVRKGPCYWRFTRYYKYLPDLTRASAAIFAAVDSGNREALRGGFEDQADELLRHRTRKDQMLAACGNEIH